MTLALLTWSVAMAGEIAIVDSVWPEYPEGVEVSLGRVLCPVQLVVAPAGTPQTVEAGVCEGPTDSMMQRTFQDAAVAAYRQWTFEPFEDPEDGTAMVVDLVAELVPAGMPRRTSPPEVMDPTALELPEPEVHTLSPGVTVWHVKVPGVRKVVVNTVFRGGMVELHGSPTELGRSLGWVLDSAGGSFSAAQLSVAKDLAEAELWSSIGVHDGGVELVVPKDQLTRGLELMTAVLRQPSFPKKDLKRYLQDRREFYEVTGPASPDQVADSSIAYAWFAADHPYGARPTPEALGAIRASSLSETYEVWRNTVPLTVLVVGDVDFSEMEAPLRKALEGFGVSGAPPEGVPVTPPQRTVYAVHMPAQEQVAIRMRTAAPAMEHEDRVAMRAGQWVLGGHFLSRLNRELREKRGYTYGSRASYHSGRTWGALTVSVTVGSDDLAETVKVVRDEVAALAMEGATPEELEAARRSAVQDWNSTLQTAETAAERYVEALDERKSLAELGAHGDELGRLTSEDVARVASKWLAGDEGRVWVFVGNRAKMETELAEAGLKPEWISPKQAILGNF